MKISLWPKDIFRGIKNFGVYWIPVLIVMLIPILLGGMIYAESIHAKRIHQKYPIGKHVVIKGTGLEGTISKVNGCGCDIEVMIVHKDGTIEKVTVDHQMIDN